MVALMAIDSHRLFIGQEIEVPVEQSKDEWSTGYSKHDIPIEFVSEGNLRKKIASANSPEATATGLQCGRAP